LLGALSAADLSEARDPQGVGAMSRPGPRPMPLSERLYRRFFLKYHARYLITDLQLRAKRQSLDYIARHMGEALIFADRWELLRFALSEAPAEGLLLELA